MELPVNYNETPYNKRWMVREAYIEKQKGICHYCQAALDGDPAKHVKCRRVDKSLFPKGFFSHPIHLHHNHETGMTIGAVHAYCNAVMWQYEGE